MRELEMIAMALFVLVVGLILGISIPFALGVVRII